MILTRDLIETDFNHSDAHIAAHNLEYIRRQLGNIVREVDLPKNALGHKVKQIVSYEDGTATHPAAIQIALDSIVRLRNHLRHSMKEHETNKPEDIVLLKQLEGILEAFGYLGFTYAG